MPTFFLVMSCRRPQTLCGSWTSQGTIKDKIEGTTPQHTNTKQHNTERKERNNWNLFLSVITGHACFSGHHMWELIIILFLTKRRRRKILRCLLLPIFCLALVFSCRDFILSCLRQIFVLVVFCSCSCPALFFLAFFLVDQGQVQGSCVARSTNALI